MDELWEDYAPLDPAFQPLDEEEAGLNHDATPAEVVQQIELIVADFAEHLVHEGAPPDLVLTGCARSAPVCFSTVSRTPLQGLAEAQAFPASSSNDVSLLIFWPWLLGKNSYGMSDKQSSTDCAGAEGNERRIPLFDRLGISAQAYTRIYCLLGVVYEQLLNNQQSSQRDLYYRHSTFSSFLQILAAFHTTFIFCRPYASLHTSPQPQSSCTLSLSSCCYCLLRSHRKPPVCRLIAKYPDLFSTPEHVNQAIQGVVQLLQVPRAALGIVCSSRGVYYGQVEVREVPGGDWTDCSTIGGGGKAIPGDCRAIAEYDFASNAR